jgi:DNA repair exonuclease SbcCD ATPase subunit
VKKKRIIIMAAGGLVSFAGMFVFAWFSTKAPIIDQRADANQPASAESEEVLQLPQTAGAAAAIGVDGKTAKKILTERQLKSLVYEVREKIQQYNSKLKELELREQRLQTSHDTLKEDNESLNDMRVELASIIANLKSERDKLLKTRVEIEQAEKANLMSIAAAYDKMEAASAGKILSSMCANQLKDGTTVKGGGLDDAVKILHYMTERTTAKVLAELVNTEPKLAAILCQRLKQIDESG